MSNPLGIEFKAWPKTTRLCSKCVITEKLHGSNGAIIFYVYESWDGQRTIALAAQTRNRLVNITNDQTGIAQWALTNYHTLVDDLVQLEADGQPKLGTFYHYGEMMHRGHSEPHFYLFNTRRWGASQFLTPTLKTVPVLFEGEYYEGVVEEMLEDLRTNGSRVHPGIPAEGVVTFWSGDGTMKKSYTGLVKQ
jgi:hypothetical protein